MAVILRTGVEGPDVHEVNGSWSHGLPLVEFCSEQAGVYLGRGCRTWNPPFDKHDETCSHLAKRGEAG